MAVTRRSLEVLNAIVAFENEKGYTPTVRQLGARLGIKAPASVHRHLERLAASKMIERPERYRLCVTEFGRRAAVESLLKVSR